MSVNTRDRQNVPDQNHIFEPRVDTPVPHLDNKLARSDSKIPQVDIDTDTVRSDTEMARIVPDLLPVINKYYVERAVYAIGRANETYCNYRASDPENFDMDNFISVYAKTKGLVALCNINCESDLDGFLGIGDKSFFTSSTYVKIPDYAKYKQYSIVPLNSVTELIIGDSPFRHTWYLYEFQF